MFNKQPKRRKPSQSSVWKKQLLGVLVGVIVFFMSYKFGSLSVQEAPEPEPDIAGQVIEETARLATLSWEPRSWIYQNFLSKTQCDYFLSRAKSEDNADKWLSGSDSTVSDNGDRQHAGEGHFLVLDEKADPVLSAIVRKLALWTQIPETHLEPLRIFKHAPGESTNLHRDFLVDDALENAMQEGGPGQRVATVVMFLNDVKSGGLLKFPDAKPEALEVPSMQGHALLYFNIKPDAGLSEESAHQLTDVGEGVTRYTVVARFRGRSLH